MFQKVALLFRDFCIRRSNIGRNKMNYMEFMRGYAIRGLRDWNEKASDSIRQNAAGCLAHKYLESRDEYIESVFLQKTSSSLPRFIPMPQPGFGKQERKRIQWTFFAPIRFDDTSQDTFRFELLILYEKKQCLAFRLEPGHRESKSHKYAHLQFNQKLYNKKVQVTGIPHFISDSFPAFPLPGSDTISLFFSMVVAVHGYEGTQIIMRRILEEDGNMRKFAKYSSALDASLHLDRNGS